MPTTPTEFRIFITYRRNDTAEHASRLHASLMEHYARDRVFLDIVSIAPGDNFTERVDQKTQNCNVLLLMIGRNFRSLNTQQACKKEENNRGETDYVYIELRAALDRGIRIVPVLLDGVTLCPSTFWPKDLVALTTRHAVSISNDNWDADTEQLVDALNRKPGDPLRRYWLRALDTKSIISNKPHLFFGVTEYYDKPLMAISEIARILAQWFRKQGYLAQVLYSADDIVVQCCDRTKWRAAIGSPIVQSVIITTDKSSMEVQFRPGIWVDQCLPEGVAHGDQFEVHDIYKKLAFLAPVAVAGIASSPFFWPLLGAGIWAGSRTGRKRENLVSEAVEFLNSVLGDSAHRSSIK